MIAQEGALRGFRAYSLARGPWTGFYPYPFLDVGVLGMPRVLANMAVMSIVFAGLGLALILIDRLLGRRA